MPCSNLFLLFLTTLNFDPMQKKYNRRYLPCILFVLIFSSCEKVIDINLDDAEKKYVIEAIITDQPGTAKVLITQTKNFDEDNNFTGISDAIVAIKETGGATT